MFRVYLVKNIYLSFMKETFLVSNVFYYFAHILQLKNGKTAAAVHPLTGIECSILSYMYHGPEYPSDVTHAFIKLIMGRMLKTQTQKCFTA